MGLYTINDIESEMTRAGSHWWDRDTMRFFKCRVGDNVYQGPGGIYFVSSEKSLMNPRKYTVRQYHPQSKDIDTVGDFNTLTRARAHSEAKRLAATPLQDQFDDAMCRLDRAVTGDDKRKNVTKYGDVNSRDLLYLSDGGYTRVSIHEYEDASGFYLVLHPTSPDEERKNQVKTRFNGAYDLQCEVCRVLKTEPAGDTAKETSDVYIEATPAQQLALDVVRGGGDCNNGIAAEMIRYAKRHHKLMEDYCNGINVYDDDDEPLPKLANVRKRLEELAKQCKLPGVVFSGDPRGCTVKLVLPNGETNDWGKEGWCIPTR